MRPRPRPRNPNIDVRNLFIEVYKAYPGSIFGREDINISNSIILPPSALQQLSQIKNFGSTQDPVLFRILNINLNMYTHCGVKEFTAQEGCCYLPLNMFDKLCLEEGQKVNLRALSLKPGTFIKLQPHKTAFIDLPNPKAILEFNLRNYFCCTEGDTIAIQFNNKIYQIDVLQCKPEKQIRTLNCNLEVDFAPPKDYKEPEKKGTNIKFNSEKQEKKLTKEEINKQITDNKFKGHHMRIDGKEVTQNQAMKVKAKKEQENNEENYDPRKCRINSNPRPEFKYVEL
jgi:ubiquitin fusion degradation protein 1